MSDTNAGQPLEGILVADFSRVLAGPLATMTLADLGARVIKVERPGHGDDTRSWGPPWSDHGSTYYESVNRGKESVTLDLTDADDLALARELARRADVVIHNFKVGTMERLGLGYADIRSTNPGVIYCAVTGFGSAGGKDLLGYDFLVQAVGGLMSITGRPDDPMKVGVALVDVLTGKDATIGILAALNARTRTGLGDFIEVSLLSSSLAAMVNQGQAALETGRAAKGMANRHPSITPYETFHTSAGELALAVGNDGQFRRLTAVLGVPELSDDERFNSNHQRVTNRDVLGEILTERLRTDTADAWVDRLTAAQVPAGKVNTIAEGIELADRLGLDPLVQVGPNHTAQIRHPVTWTTYQPAKPTAPPLLGEQDETIRTWLQPTHEPTPR